LGLAHSDIGNVAVLLAKDRGLQTYLAAVLLFPFLAAPLTRGGPARVYLPLVPFGLLAAAIGVVQFGETVKTKFNAALGRSLIWVAVVAPMTLLPAGLRIGRH